MYLYLRLFYIRMTSRVDEMLSAWVMKRRWAKNLFHLSCCQWMNMSEIFIFFRNRLVSFDFCVRDNRQILTLLFLVLCLAVRWTHTVNLVKWNVLMCKVCVWPTSTHLSHTVSRGSSPVGKSDAPVLHNDSWLQLSSGVWWCNRFFFSLNA